MLGSVPQGTSEEYTFNSIRHLKDDFKKDDIFLSDGCTIHLIVSVLSLGAGTNLGIKGEGAEAP